MNKIINSLIDGNYSRLQEAGRSRVCKEALPVFVEYMTVNKPHGWTDMMQYAEKMDTALHQSNPELFGAGEAYKYDFEKNYGENWYVVTFRAACVEVRGKEFWEKWKKANRKYAWSDV